MVARGASKTLEQRRRSGAKMKGVMSLRGYEGSKHFGGSDKLLVFLTI
jgi:hypothetical protein